MCGGGDGDAKLAEQRKRMRDNLVKCKSGSGKRGKRRSPRKKKEEEINKNRFVSFSLLFISENHHHLFMHPIF